MPFSRPTLETLIDRIDADIETRLPGASAKLRRTVEGVLSRAFAGATHGLHGHAAFLSKQIIPDTAEADFLSRWADVWGVTRKVATFFKATAQFTGTNGSPVPLGTLVENVDGDTYTTDAAGTVASGSVNIAITASTSGKAPNLADGATVTLVNPVAGIDTDATIVAASQTNGVDRETDDALRDRLLLNIQEQPDAGGPGDYVRFALEISGVTRAFEFPLNRGAGTVDVTFVQDANPDISPTAGKITEVQAHIDTKRPVTADVLVFSITATAQAVTIANLTPDTTAIRAAITTALEDMIKREAKPGGTIPLSKWTEAISGAPGEEDHNLTTPAADVVSPQNQITVLGTVTFV